MELSSSACLVLPGSKPIGRIPKRVKKRHSNESLVSCSNKEFESTNKTLLVIFPDFKRNDSDEN